MELVPDPTNLQGRREFAVSRVEDIDQKIGSLLVGRHNWMQTIKRIDGLIEAEESVGQPEINTLFALDWEEHDGAA